MHLKITNSAIRRVILASTEQHATRQCRVIVILSPPPLTHLRSPYAPTPARIQFGFLSDKSNNTQKCVLSTRQTLRVETTVKRRHGLVI